MSRKQEEPYSDKMCVGDYDTPYAKGVCLYYVNWDGKRYVNAICMHTICKRDFAGPTRNDCEYLVGEKK